MRVYWTIPVIASILILSVFTISPFAFADDDDEDDDDDDNKKEPKTLESECAKKLKKKNLNLDGLFCLAIISIQDMLDMVKADIAQLQNDLETIELTPGPQGPRGDNCSVSEDPLTGDITIACQDGSRVTFNPGNMASVPLSCDTSTGDYCDDFTSYTSDANFAVTYPTTQTGEIEGIASTNQIDYDFVQTGNTQEVLYYDLGEDVVENTWIIRSQLEVENLTLSTSANNIRLYFGLGNNTSAADVTQNFIGFALSPDQPSNRWRTADIYNGLLSSVSTDTGDSLSTGTFYTEMIILSML